MRRVHIGKNFRFRTVRLEKKDQNFVWQSRDLLDNNFTTHLKILVVGNGQSAIHEVAVANAFKKLGYQVDSFYWYKYFQTRNPLLRLWCRVQNKFLIGPRINKLNSDLILKAVEFYPKLIFIYRGTHITPGTLSRLKRCLPDCEIFGYNNDDPFAAGHPSLLWRHFIQCLPLYDIVFAYRHRNLGELSHYGAKKVELLRSWYLPYLHCPCDEDRSYAADCVYVGHYEADNRGECLEALIESGINVKLYGPYSGLKNFGWDGPISRSRLLQRLLPVSYLTGKSYSIAIGSAPIALCFLSKLNGDTYTRRCFEIPAIGSALFSEYSDDLASMFIDGKEAVFFKNKNELVQKVKYYLAHPDELKAIQINGRNRVISDGHDIYARLQSVISLVNS